jgi:hypothetical protein
MKVKVWDENDVVITLTGGAELALSEQDGGLYIRAREGHLAVLPKVSNAAVIRVEGGR